MEQKAVEKPFFFWDLLGKLSFEYKMQNILYIDDSRDLGNIKLNFIIKMCQSNQLQTTYLITTPKALFKCYAFLSFYTPHILYLWSINLAWQIFMWTTEWCEQLYWLGHSREPMALHIQTYKSYIDSYAATTEGQYQHANTHTHRRTFVYCISIMWPHDGAWNSTRQ